MPNQKAAQPRRIAYAIGPHEYLSTQDNARAILESLVINNPDAIEIEGPGTLVSVTTDPLGLIQLYEYDGELVNIYTFKLAEIETIKPDQEETDNE